MIVLVYLIQVSIGIGVGLSKAWVYAITFLFHLWPLVCLFCLVLPSLPTGQVRYSPLMAEFYSVIRFVPEPHSPMRVSFHTITTCPSFQNNVSLRLFMEDCALPCACLLVHSPFLVLIFPSKIPKKVFQKIPMPLIIVPCNKKIHFLVPKFQLCLFEKIMTTF